MPLKNKMLATLLFLLNFHPSYSQQHPGKKMLSYSKESVFVELADQYATVFKLGQFYDKGYNGPSIIYIDTLVKQTGINDESYTGKRAHLSQSGNKYYLKLERTGPKKHEAVELNLSNSVEKDYLEINRAYWLDAFIKLSIEINSRFSLQHYSFRGFHNFDHGNQDLLPYEQFKILADNKIKTLRDSLISKHSNYTSITNDVINNFGSIEYSLIKERLEKLGEKPEGYSYFNVILQRVCNERPEWFYKLAEDIPSNKELMFSSVYGNSIVKKLKAVKTDSPVKKEFIKYKRKDRRLTFTAIGTSIVGAALLGFAVITLVN